ncbi:tubulin-specific chaperone C [Aphidius gifuensis]|uniref:tubulin-specific chaperone C n=1 Tax=Aphidius gifuensis TaxID=684658 RepID=UPI001CDBB4B0|nr:tubulin-specific chaperone C [Aphidius gifuensis]
MDTTNDIIDNENFTDRMSKRDRERKIIIEKRKEEKQQLSVDSEQLGYFKSTFYDKCNKIQLLLDSITSTTPLLTDLFDKITKDIQLLKNYLSQSKIFLKVYDIRRAQENLQHLENKTSELEDKYIPKKKFGFKKRCVINKNITIDNKIDVTDNIKNDKIIIDCEISKHNDLMDKYNDNKTTIINRINEKIILDANDVNKNDIMLDNLNNCQVKIYGSPSTLHMVNLVNCIILIGPVSSSVFAHNCNDCTFVFACQQFRLHSSINCNVYIHVTSRAIIEDCKNINVAPYNWNYDEQQNHYLLSGLDVDTNNWDSLDDFNWLSYEIQSPNWNIIKPELRIQNWNL